MCIKPLRKVPLVRTTALARTSMPSWVLTPTQRPCSVKSPTTPSCQKSRLGVASNISRHVWAKRLRSFWVRGLHMAGPLDLLSMRNWMALRSDTKPE